MVSFGKQFVTFQRIMVPSSSGSSHFVGLPNPKYEGSFEMSETVCPVTQYNIPEALIFQHDVLPSPMTVLQLKPALDMNYFLLYIQCTYCYICVCVYYNITLPICKS
jgi:hypothetical protein